MSAPARNHNARRGPVAATRRITVRCTPGDKARWIKSARAAGLTLSAWTVDALAHASERRTITPAAATVAESRAAFGRALAEIAELSAGGRP
jgi:hypothetical protein